MSKVESICLSCKKFRPLDVNEGLCRLKKQANVEDYPKKNHKDSCESWVNCGQKYYIRLGWLKKMEEKGSEVN